jgi:CheY-like chemotaxis protein
MAFFDLVPAKMREKKLTIHDLQNILLFCASLPRFCPERKTTGLGEKRHEHPLAHRNRPTAMAPVFHRKKPPSGQSLLKKGRPIHIFLFCPLRPNAIVKEGNLLHVPERIEKIMSDKLDISLLYVEDEALIRLAVAHMLKRLVRELHIASNGEEGLALFRTIRPDVVITDIRMPIMDGLALVEQIRRIDQECIIIVGTAYSDTEYFLQLIGAGINHYLLKPIREEQCLEALRKSSETIRLKKELQRYYESLERDLQLAGNLQRQLLPKADTGQSPASVRALFFPMQHVSGDFFDYKWSENRRILQGCVLDVMGHGLSAALQVSALSLLFRQSCERNLFPGDTLSFLNGEFLLCTRGEAFAAGIVFRFDFFRNKLTYASAGGGQFLALAASFRGFVRTPGLFLGVESNTLYEEHSLPISPNDAFFFLSDGFYESFPQEKGIADLTLSETENILLELAHRKNPTDDASALIVHVDPL